MKGILSDVNILGQLQALMYILEGDYWREVWRSLDLAVYTFADFGLPVNTADSVIWQVCQQRHVLLLTGNRNKTGPDSLEATIEEFNTPSSLPVLTIGDPEQVLRNRSYAERTVARFLEYVIDVEKYRGTGRLWIP